jgi:hypothetical protein
MKLTNIGKLVGISLFSIMMVGCGGGSSSDGGTTPIEPAMNPGGTADNPSEIRLDMRNEISKNSFYNYYKYYSVEGEKLVIHVTLDKELKAVDVNNCNYMGSTFIAVYDEYEEWMSEFRTCGRDLEVTFPTTGEYKFKIIYPNDYYSGYFEAASIMP